MLRDFSTFSRTLIFFLLTPFFPALPTTVAASVHKSEVWLQTFLRWPLTIDIYAVNLPLISQQYLIINYSSPVMTIIINHYPMIDIPWLSQLALRPCGFAGPPCGAFDVKGIEGQRPGHDVLKCWRWLEDHHTYDWIGLRENLQETIDFPMKYGAFL